MSQAHFPLTGPRRQLPFLGNVKIYLRLSDGLWNTIIAYQLVTLSLPAMSIFDVIINKLLNIERWLESGYNCHVPHYGKIVILDQAQTYFLWMLLT